MGNCHVHLLCRSQVLPYPLLHSLTMSFLVFQNFLIQSSSLFRITCPYHQSLPLLMTVVIGSTPTSLLNSSLVHLSFMEIPHIHPIICISALSNFNPISNSKGLVVVRLAVHVHFNLGLEIADSRTASVGLLHKSDGIIVVEEIIDIM